MKYTIDEAEARYVALVREMSDGANASDPSKMAELGREFKRLDAVVALADRRRTLLDAADYCASVARNDDDPGIRELAETELSGLRAAIDALDGELSAALSPELDDDDDDRETVLEIRAGIGGEEACLFVGDLLDMYWRYCERHGLKLEVTECHEGPSGGYREVVATVSGDGAYGLLKYESGVHRVQRVPKTETQGRLHTSVATVVAMPQADEAEARLDMGDVTKETFCSSGAGGQGVNTTYSAVRLTHRPTGIVVSCQNDRSQHSNYASALRVLRSRLYDAEVQRRRAAESSARKDLLSTGDRSAKIRTYNYPQGRVTDHRIGMSDYNLASVMCGGLDGFVAALRTAESRTAAESHNDRSNA